MFLSTLTMFYFITSTVILPRAHLKKYENSKNTVCVYAITQAGRGCGKQKNRKEMAYPLLNVLVFIIITVLLFPEEQLMSAAHFLYLHPPATPTFRRSFCRPLWTDVRVLYILICSTPHLDLLFYVFGHCRLLLSWPDTAMVISFAIRSEKIAGMDRD